MLMTGPATSTIPDKNPPIPRSVQTLRHNGDVYYKGMPSEAEFLAAIQGTNKDPVVLGKLVLAIEESDEMLFAHMLVEKVATGRRLHELFTDLTEKYSLQRPDLLDWTDIFV